MQKQVVLWVLLLQCANLVLGGSSTTYYTVVWQDSSPATTNMAWDEAGATGSGLPQRLNRLFLTWVAGTRNNMCYEMSGNQVPMGVLGRVALRFNRVRCLSSPCCCFAQIWCKGNCNPENTGGITWSSVRTVRANRSALEIAPAPL